MKKRIFTSFDLKMIAIIVMTIDHFSAIIGQSGLLAIFPDASLKVTYTIVNVMRGIGRIAFPLFAFMIAEGASKTRSMPKYIGRLSLFALISEPIYYYAMNLSAPSMADFLGGLLKLRLTNVFATLALGAIAIYIYQIFERKKSKRLMLCFIPLFIVITLIGGYIHCDYGMQGILLIFALYIAKTTPLKSLVILIWSLCVYMLWAGSFEHFIFASISCVFVCLYNGERGRPLKWIFYVYYPLHMLILSLINKAIT